MKYATVDVIYQRLAQTLRSKDINFYDIVEWCAQCEIEEIGMARDLFEFRDVDLTIADLQGAVPSNCFAIKAVKRNNTSVDFINNGSYLNFKKNYTDVKIDYWGIPIDAETGLPVIVRGHEQACYWYCLKNLYLEDYLDGKIDQNRWNTIERSYEAQLTLSKSRSFKLTDNDRIKAIDAMRTIIYNYRNLSRTR